jgi:hypothetical protein
MAVEKVGREYFQVCGRCQHFEGVAEAEISSLGWVSIWQGNDCFFFSFLYIAYAHQNQIKPPTAHQR